VSALVSAALALLGVVAVAPAAQAAVTPTFTLTAPADALQGGTFDVTLSARNPTLTPAYNMTYRLILPPGVTVDPATSLPPTTAVTDGGTGITTAVWTNISDLLAGSPGPESALTVTLVAGATRALGAVPLAADAYVSDLPRLLPQFAADGSVIGGFTGRASSTASTDLVPFTITKSTAANEKELLRGVHDHRTTVTLTLENSTLAPSTALEIVDHLPAQLEFLGCGVAGDDNSSAEEYAGSGPLNASSFALSAPCPTPSFVDTQTLDPDGAGPLALGVYTVVRWSTADLGALGALAPGATTTLQYVVGIPQLANVPFPGGTPTTGVQASNLDNNTGDSTIETATEQSATNLVQLTGTYDDPAPGGAPSQQYGASATDTVSIEDVAIAKTEASNSAGDGSIAHGGTTVWNLLIRVSEYTTDVSSLVVSDTVPDGLDVVGASPTATSVGAPALDGTIVVRWDLTPPPLASNDTLTVQLTTQTRVTYRADPTQPVRANDSWTNTVTLAAVATDLDGTVRPVEDASAATQTGEPIRLIKQVAAPGAGATAIGRCQAAAWPAVNAPAGSPPSFGPGDLVCWRLTVQAPDGLDTTNQALVDFLPRGFDFVAAEETAGSAVDILTQVVDAPRITWTFENNGNLLAGQAAQLVLASTIVDPSAAQPGEIPGNLAKLVFLNTPEELFQLRAQADVQWVEPVVSLDKSVVITGPDTAVKASATGGDTLTYSVAVRNDGTVPVQDIEVRDLLPSQFACVNVVSSVPAATGCTDATRDYLDWTVAGPVAAGATVTLTYQVLVPATVVPGTSLVNNAGVRQFNVATTNPDAPLFTWVPSTNIDPTLEPSANAPRADDTASVPVQTIGLTKSAATSVVVTGGNTNDQATPGEVVTYTVTATLPAETTITAGVLTDTVPGVFTLDQASALVARNDSASAASFVLSTTATQMRLDLPTPYVVGATDEVVRITFNATVKDASGPVAGANVTNTATLTATGMTTRNASVSTRIVEPNIRVTKAELDTNNVAEPGEEIAFSVTVTNPGPNASSPWTSTAYDNQVVDVIPTSMTPLSGPGGTPLNDGEAVASGGLWDSAARTITWTSATTPALGAIAPNGSVALPYSVRVADPIPSPTSFTNTVAVTTTSLSGTDAGERGYTLGGPSAGRYRSTSAVTLGGPEPTLTKTVTPLRAVPGQVVTFTLRATIPPQVTTNNVTILDTLPTGLTFVRIVSSSCTSTGTCTLTPTALTPQGQRIGWTLGDAAAQPESRVVEIVYEAYVDGSVVAVSQDDTLTNSARVRFSATPGTPPTTPSDADALPGASPVVTATVTVDEPVLSLTKTVAQGAGQVANRRVVPGESLTYSIIVSSTGPVTAYDVVVDDVTDGRFGTITSVTGATLVDGTAPTLRFTVPSIAAGASVTITYVVVVPALTSGDEVVGPELTNTAVSTYTSLSGLPTGARSYTSNDDTVTLEVDVASLGDTVWFDLDGNGVQGPGEAGVADVDVTVRYAGPDGTFGTADDEDHLVTTGANGTYLVSNLPGGLFRVILDASTLPAGTVVTTDLDGAANGLGTAQLTLLQDDDRRDADFGIRGTGTVGDLVWLDLDADGVQDSVTSEPGLAGVELTISWPATGNLPAGSVTTTTNGAGAWSVTGVPAADITVTVNPATFPPGTVLVSEPHGGAVDGTATFPLAPGATDNGFDFGLRGAGLLGDRLWVDTNRDGVQDAGEPGIPGATVEVRWFGVDLVAGTADDAVLVLTTGADGTYLAEHLPLGDYSVTVLTLPTALAPTYDEDSGTTAPDRTTAVTLTPTSTEHRTADFGFVAETGVGDRVWLDQNGDGVQDPGEPGIPGIEITVTSAGANGILGDSDDIVRTTTTGANGAWTVTGLPAVLTRVEVTGGLPGGLEATFDADGIASPGVSEVLLVADAYNDLQDFGYRGLNSIGDRTWVDVDRDGVQDAGEPGLGGLTVVVTYLGADGIAGGGDDLVLTTITATDGSYTVPGLPDGDFTVEVTAGVPAGYTPTWDETGDPDGSSVVTGLGVGLATTVDHDTADFGYGGTGALGGKVWLERRVDGVLTTPTEAGIPGIGIDVTWAGPDGVLGTPDDVVVRAVTGPGGVWLVEGMPPGPFVATVDPTTLPPGTAVVWDRENGSVAPNGTLSGTLAPDERRLDVDTGVRGAGSIGDLVWVDQNRNGTRDAGEPGAPNVRVVVTWHGPDGVLGGGDDVAVEERTGADGTYLADGLPAGRFTVTFDRTTFPRGTTAYADVDGGDPLVSTVDLAAGQNRTDVDLVLRPTALALTGASVGLLVLLMALLLGSGVVLRRRAVRALPADAEPVAG